jgi:hypothetical protein
MRAVEINRDIRTAGILDYRDTRRAVGKELMNVLFGLLFRRLLDPLAPSIAVRLFIRLYWKNTAAGFMMLERSVQQVVHAAILLACCRNQSAQVFRATIDS